MGQNEQTRKPDDSATPSRNPWPAGPGAGNGGHDDLDEPMGATGVFRQAKPGAMGAPGSDAAEDSFLSNFTGLKQPGGGSPGASVANAQDRVEVQDRFDRLTGKPLVTGEPLVGEQPVVSEQPRAASQPVGNIAGNRAGTGGLAEPVVHRISFEPPPQAAVPQLNVFEPEGAKAPQAAGQPPPKTPSVSSPPPVATPPPAEASAGFTQLLRALTDKPAMGGEVTPPVQTEAGSKSRSPEVSAPEAKASPSFEPQRAVAEPSRAVEEMGFTSLLRTLGTADTGKPDRVTPVAQAVDVNHGRETRELAMPVARVEKPVTSAANPPAGLAAVPQAGTLYPGVPDAGGFTSLLRGVSGEVREPVSAPERTPDLSPSVIPDAGKPAEAKPGSLTQLFTDFYKPEEQAVAMPSVKEAAKPNSTPLEPAKASGAGNPSFTEFLSLSDLGSDRGGGAAGQGTISGGSVGSTGSSGLSAATQEPFASSPFTGGYPVSGGYPATRGFTGSDRANSDRANSERVSSDRGSSDRIDPGWLSSGHEASPVDYAPQGQSPYRAAEPRAVEGVREEKSDSPIGMTQLLNLLDTPSLQTRPPEQPVKTASTAPPVNASFTQQLEKVTSQDGPTWAPVNPAGGERSGRERSGSERSGAEGLPVTSMPQVSRESPGKPGYGSSEAVLGANAEPSEYTQLINAAHLREMMRSGQVAEASSGEAAAASVATGGQGGGMGGWAGLKPPALSVTPMMPAMPAMPAVPAIPMGHSSAAAAPHFQLPQVQTPQIRTPQIQVPQIKTPEMPAAPVMGKLQQLMPLLLICVIFLLVVILVTLIFLLKH